MSKCKQVAQNIFYLCGVKKSRLVTRAWLSIILLLLAVLLPHHHHDGGLTCVTFEHCHTNTPSSDARHAHGHHGKSNSHPCVLSVAVVKLTPSKGEHPIGVPLYFLPVSFVQLPAPQVQQMAVNAPGSSKRFDLACPFSKHLPTRGPPALLV